MKSVISRLIGFSGLSLLSAIVPLLVLPVVARVGGESAWAAIGVGQAIGTLVGTFSTLGWGVAGPSKIALAPNFEVRHELYTLSYWSRLAAFIVAEVAGCTVAVSLTPTQQHPLVILMTIAAGMSGLSIAWFSVGAGVPRILAVYEVTPRLLASIVAIPIVAATKDVIGYPILIIGGTSVGLAVFHLTSYKRIIPPLIPWNRFVSELREDVAATGINLIGAGFSVLPVPISATIGSISETASFSSADRLFRYSLFTITSLANALQPWVLEQGSGRKRARRQKIATASHVVLGCLGGAGLALLGKPLSAILFGDSVAASPGIVGFYGVTFAAVSISTPYIRNKLIPRGRSNLVLLATFTGVLLGFVALIYLPTQIGLIGVAASLAISDTIIMLLLVMSSTTLRPGLSPGRRSTASANPHIGSLKNPSPLRPPKE